AVRAPPTWRWPVGLGAKRTRTVPLTSVPTRTARSGRADRDLASHAAILLQPRAGARPGAVSDALLFELPREELDDRPGRRRVADDFRLTASAWAVAAWRQPLINPAPAVHHRPEKASRMRSSKKCRSGRDRRWARLPGGSETRVSPQPQKGDSPWTRARSTTWVMRSPSCRPTSTPRPPASSSSSASSMPAGAGTLDSARARPGSPGAWGLPGSGPRTRPRRARPGDAATAGPGPRAWTALVCQGSGPDPRGHPGDRGAALGGGPRRHGGSCRTHRARLASGGPQGRGSRGRPPARRPGAARVSR